MTTMVDFGSVFEIVQALFSSMIDGDEGLLLPRDESARYEDPLAAWVDVKGPFTGCAVLQTENGTAHDLVRALMEIAPDAPVSDGDLVDAFGEIANVVGGNVKALLPDQGTLSLPQVSAVAPQMSGEPLIDLRLTWRGSPIDLTIWLTDSEGEQP
jgi:chemotaxis protein CheX